MFKASFFVALLAGWRSSSRALAVHGKRSAKQQPRTGEKKLFQIAFAMPWRSFRHALAQRTPSRDVLERPTEATPHVATCIFWTARDPSVDPGDSDTSFDDGRMGAT